jgi:hypothetical protein
MARVYDFWLGGKDNFAADRVVAEQVAAVYPDVRAAVRAQRAFLARAVHFLVAEEGIRQFLDIGTGLPSANNTHQDVAAEEVAQGVQRYNERAAAPVAARTHAEVCRFFAGLDLVEPGVVQAHRWRPGVGDLSGGHDLAIYAGVGRKP